MKKNRHLISGIHAVTEALGAGRELERVLVRQGGGSERLTALRNELKERGVPFRQVPAARLNRLTGQNHQGVVAWLSIISYSDISTLLPGIFEKGEDPLVLILDGISDVRNFGAIARSAECAGVHALVIPRAGSVTVSEDAIRTSAGALHRIPVCRHGSLGEVCRFLSESGLRIFAATEEAPDALYSTDLTGPAAVIMGSEERGISPSLMRISDHQISIPLLGDIGSLNVSVATGIILYEIGRQRAMRS